MTQKTIEDLLSLVGEFSYDELTEALRHKVENENIPFYKVEQVGNYLKSAKIKKINSEKETSPRKYADLEMGVQSALNVLNNDLLYQDALDEAALMLGRDTQYALDTKNSPYKHSRDVVKAHKDNPTLQDMKLTVKLRDIDLNKTTTLWQFIHLLSRNKELYDQFIELLDTVKKQGEDIESLKAESSLHEVDISSLKELVGLDDLPNKQKAIILLKKGIKVSQIADKLGVSERTVQRWRKMSNE